MKTILIILLGSLFLVGCNSGDDSGCLYQPCAKEVAKELKKEKAVIDSTATKFIGRLLGYGTPLATYGHDYLRCDDMGVRMVTIPIYVRTELGIDTLVYLYSECGEPRHNPDVERMALEFSAMNYFHDKLAHKVSVSYHRGPNYSGPPSVFIDPSDS